MNYADGYEPSHQKATEQIHFLKHNFLWCSKILALAYILPTCCEEVSKKWSQISLQMNTFPSPLNICFVCNKIFNLKESKNKLEYIYLDIP